MTASRTWFKGWKDRFQAFTLYAVLALVVFFLVFGTKGCSAIMSYTTGATVTVTFEKGERINTRSASYYLIWGQHPDGHSEAFTVSDDPYRLHFNSSDLYGKLEKGKTYTLYVTGWRMPFFSAYRNVYGMKEETPQ